MQYQIDCLLTCPKIKRKNILEYLVSLDDLGFIKVRMVWPDGLARWSSDDKEKGKNKAEPMTKGGGVAVTLGLKGSGNWP